MTPARKVRDKAERVFTVAHPDHEVVLFFNGDGSADACVSDKSGKETVRVRIAAPPEGSRIVVIRAEGSVEVLYRSAQP
jgi:hypothetical protein